MKALVGSWDHRPYQLLAEITALRTRVRELERELADARAENDLLRGDGISIDDIEVVLTR